MTLGLDGLTEDLTAVLPAIAFGLGLVFGLTFDTSGPRTRPVVEEARDVVDRDEVVVAKAENGNGAVDRGTPVAPQPEPAPRRGMPADDD